MVEQEATKVYELAKELGLDSISLLDKLKELKIKVKNHMSEITEDDLRVARESLIQKKAAPAAAKAKKAPLKAKKKAEEAPESEKSEKTAKKAVTKTKATKTATAASADTASAEKKTSAVIRRRVKADGEATETVVSGSLPKAKPPAGASAVDEYEELSPKEQDRAELVSAENIPTEEVPLEPEAATAIYEQEATVEHLESSAASGGIETVQISASGMGSPANTPTPRTPYVPNRPVAPRRSILTIVDAPKAPPRSNVVKPAAATGTGLPGQKTNVKGIATADKDGFRVIKMDKQSLDQMVEEETAKRRGSGREAEIRPEDVRFADYRKKEMVFLPKKKKIPIGKEIRKTKLTQPKATKRVVEMGAHISIQDLATQLTIKGVDVVRKLMGMGQTVNILSVVDFDTATLIAADYQFEVKNIAFNEASVLAQAEATPDQLIARPPIVTIMGHVDHGKTSLLDAIREAKVAEGEAGGITQHIGAYTITKDGKEITFIDTPGHEAFTVMRARGANVTDIVILVVAADDGVMPQTREALSHAQAAGVPIIVAVNKMDKPGANPEKVKQQLAELNVLAEDWGGQTMFIPVSAIKKTGLDKLLEAILLQTEVLELKANPNMRAAGTVLEARLDKGRGPVVSVLIKAGTLHVGDYVLAGPFTGRVKAMMDDKARTMKVALPGYAVEVLGFEGVPHAGEKFDCAASETDARSVISSREEAIRIAKSIHTKPTLDDLFSKVEAGSIKELNIILKGDVFGSIEAIRESLVKSSTEKVKVKVIHAAPGGITESDILLATASHAIIIGFNVRPETKARQLAEAEHVEIKCYNVIYELLDDVRKAMTGLLDKKAVEKYLGRAEVRQTFTVPKIGMIAGSSVIDGKIIRGANVRLLRESRIIYEGKMTSLKRFKDDAKEVAQGFECGIGLENYNDLKPGDLIEAYQIDMIAPEL